jgi:hypothetical protein
MDVSGWTHLPQERPIEFVESPLDRWMRVGTL